MTGILLRILANQQPYYWGNLPYLKRWFNEDIILTFFFPLNSLVIDP
ncbi:hypothetical protein L0B53_06030 [Vibrio sp. SS-MA-C1-2]|nr:hypothetical protein [Vibrio sp. SS-MA-C1-2]UJF19135.1 hypothetical protein L0B53_06030 [Vibrio sp. SS-MA-C1-2]